MYKFIDYLTIRMYQGNNLKNGDIIFLTSMSSQRKDIHVVTNSKYSHLGIIYAVDNEYFVYKDNLSVKFTPFNEWINNGLDGKYFVKRIKDSENILITDALINMNNVGEKFKNKGCDKYFEWSVEKI
jgi:hypothetical protein